MHSPGSSWVIAQNVACSKVGGSGKCVAMHIATETSCTNYSTLLLYLTGTFLLMAANVLLATVLQVECSNLWQMDRPL